MENNELKFKTNINCGGCITAVTPFLNQLQGITHWEVDTTKPEKVLTVRSEGIEKADVIATVQKAGFKIEVL